jgi:hypothetical protein
MMVFPLILGYVVGAAGAYALLFRKAPVIEEEFFEGKNSDGSTAEVVELFPATEVSAEKKAA